MASNYGMLMLNKAIQAESFNVFSKHGVNEDSFISNSDREVYRFLEDYNRRNGSMPSYAMVSDSVDGFTYIPDVTDKFETLAKGVLDRRATVAFNEYFQKDFANLKKETGGDTSELISHLTEDLNNIRVKYTNTRSVGTNIKTNTEDYIREYKSRQAGESFKTWKSFMPYINREIGGYTSGNMYVWYGQSGRGKTAITFRELLEIAQQGANVLLWSLEMPVYEVMTRLYSQLSAKLGKTTVSIRNDDGASTREIVAGFDSTGMRKGELSESHEKSLVEMLDEINKHVSGNIHIRGVDDEDFHKRDLGQLQADIEATNADLVVIDPFYYLQYEKNTSKTAGGDASETSKKLRSITGRMGVVTFAMTQAEEAESSGDEEVRELRLPKRSETKKTKSLLEDAATLIAIDTDYKQLRGILGINKGRDGGEGTRCELTFIPKYGVIEELKLDADEMFDF